MSRLPIRALWVGILLAAMPGCRRQAPEHERVTARGEAVRIAAGKVPECGACFFTLQHEGRNINFFLRRDGKGVMRAHFDACYSCYKYRQGYVQQGSEVVCIACRIGYDLSVPIWDYVGPCVPISLSCRIEGSEVLLPVSALRKGWRFF